MQHALPRQGQRLLRTQLRANTLNAQLMRAQLLKRQPPPRRMLRFQQRGQRLRRIGLMQQTQRRIKTHKSFFRQRILLIRAQPRQ